MARVVPDYTQGEWTETQDGVRCVRTFSVHDLGGASSSVIKRAVEDPGIPALEAPHPDDSSIVVTDKSGSPMHDNSVLVRVTYEIPTWQNAPGTIGQEITLDASVIESKTYFDINGVRLSAVYDTGPATITHYPSTNKTTNVVTATINKVETTSEADLMLLAINYVDSVNDAPWFGWPARTWRVEDIQVRPSQFSGKREVSYVVSYKPDDWRFLAVYIENGRVPPDASSGNGFEKWDVRELTDFTQLPITVPTMPP